MLKRKADDLVAHTTQSTTEVDLKNIKKKSLSGIISFFIRTILLQVIGFVSALILSVFLGPEEFGVYGIVTQIIALLIFFLTLV